MKFSHSLQFNAVPEWSKKYISYTTLKKLIYSLQRESLKAQKEDPESAFLIADDDPLRKPVAVFSAALDAELKKIDEFYQAKETEIFQTLEDLLFDVELYENELMTAEGDRSVSNLNLGRSRLPTDSRRRRRAGSDTSGEINIGTTDGETENDPDPDDADEENGHDPIHPFDAEQAGASGVTRAFDGAVRSPRSFSNWSDLKTGSSVSHPQLQLLSESRVLLRKKVIAMYTSLSELKGFIDLNQTGFKKALKKFDKSLNTSLKSNYLMKLPNQTHVFKPETIRSVTTKMSIVVEVYAKLSTNSDIEAAISELSIHLREHVVWERNTVWRDMIGIERKSQAANTNSKSTEPNRSDKFSFNGFSFRNATLLKSCAISFVTILLLNVSPFDDIAQKNCFALLICASLLWATETIPLFVTSLLVPLLIVTFGVLKNGDGSLMSNADASKYILSTMWNSVILLLLGGFTLAASLTKFSIAKIISTWVLSKAGTNPSVVLLTIMSIALFASMWVSNVAAPVLCFSLIQPLLRTLPRGSPFAQALILGIALASNIGGMALPIASPQNMIAIGAMQPPPSWGEWFTITTPICILSLVLIWAFLLMTFKVDRRMVKLVTIRMLDDKFTATQWYVVIVSLGTIILWCFASRLTGIFGEMGIIALLPVVLFFGPGLLSTEDFNNYPWNIVVLAMGGTALGKAVASSGLLSTIAVTIRNEIETFSLFGVTLTFGLLILIMATFVSHTVAALIVVPLVAEIGESLPNPHPRLLIMASALLCSAAMGLPTSGFPNVTAICLTDELGNSYLTVNTFITRGVPSSVIAYAIIVSIGFGIMKLINF